MIALRKNKATTQDYYSQALINECLEPKLKISNGKEMFDFSNYSIKLK